MKYESILLRSIIAVVFISCNNHDDEKNMNESIVIQPVEEQIELECDSSNSTFKQLYSVLANNSGNYDEVSMDTDYHTYTFEVMNNKTICKIGYQSLATFNTTPYLIEIFDNTTNAIIYSGSHLFSSVNTSYVDIVPIQVQTNHSYTIKRIQTNWNGNVSNTIGRLILGSVSFPVIHGDLKITEASFYRDENDSLFTSPYVPYIDIVFQE